ncbi:MAG: thiol protease/hemagglutinin PrtT [Bacteroidales bacterium]|jgi:hypothetical protein
MRKVILLTALLFSVSIAFAKPISKDYASRIAYNYYKQYEASRTLNFSISNSYEIKYDGKTTMYVFNFSSGGFVIVAADDASIPVLGTSSTGEIKENCDNLNLNWWLSCYSREIIYITKNNISNKATVKEWNNIANEVFPAPAKNTRDVNQLLTTTWDQGNYYNDSCPVDAGGPDGRCLTGCVATAMGQVMKYYNYPTKGVGYHSYVHSTYGTLSANFGNTTYNWGAMTPSITSVNSAVATLLYHCGVAVEMGYGPSASGATTSSIPDALMNYFDYANTAEIKDKSNYPNDDDWKGLIINELSSSHPVLYTGIDNTEGGHAFVCDGYRSSDQKFHFNWGWSGNPNNYFAIGALNPAGYAFNSNNMIVIGIKPKFIPPPVDDAYKLMSNKLDPDSIPLYPLLTYNWIDITDGSGTEVTGLTDDGVKGPFSLGQDYIFFRDQHKFNKIWIGDNGHVNFQDGSALSASFPTIPATKAPNDFIAPLEADLLPSSATGAKIYYKVDTNKFIVTWKDYPHWQSAAPGYSGKITMQAIYYKDGNFKFQYQSYLPFTWPSGSDLEKDPIIGCENSSGTIGYAWLNYNTPLARHDSIFNNGATFVPGLCILGYYTHKHPSIKDLTVEYVTLEGINKTDNKGYPIFSGNKKLTAKISNVGTIGASSVIVKGAVQPVGGSVTTIPQEIIDTIPPGESVIKTLATPFNFTKAPSQNFNTYTVRMRQTTTGDIEAGNDSLTVEYVVMDDTLIVKKSFGWGNRPVGSTFYLFGFDNGGVDFIPPSGYYPVQIDSIAFIAGRNTNETSVTDKNTYFRLYKIDSAGVIDTLNPLTAILAYDLTTFESQPSGTLQRFSLPISGVTLQNEGEGLAVKFTPTPGMRIVLDDSGPFSRRNYELLGADWTPSRENETRDACIYVVWTFPNTVGIKGKIHSECSLTNYPNPFSKYTTIEFYNKEKGNVKLNIYDINGKLIKTIVDDNLSEGKYKFNFNGSQLNGGIYFYRLETQNYIATKKLTIIK